MDKNKNIALLFAGATSGLNNHYVLAVTPATEEFFHISPALIISSAIKRGGVNKSTITKCAGNFQSSPATCRTIGDGYRDVNAVNADNRRLLNNKPRANWF